MRLETFISEPGERSTSGLARSLSVVLLAGTFFLLTACSGGGGGGTPVPDGGGGNGDGLVFEDDAGNDGHGYIEDNGGGDGSSTVGQTPQQRIIIMTPSKDPGALYDYSTGDTDTGGG